MVAESLTLWPTNTRVGPLMPALPRFSRSMHLPVACAHVLFATNFVPPVTNGPSASHAAFVELWHTGGVPGSWQQPSSARPTPARVATEMRAHIRATRSLGMADPP